MHIPIQVMEAPPIIFNQMVFGQQNHNTSEFLNNINSQYNGLLTKSSIDFRDQFNSAVNSFYGDKQDILVKTALAKTKSLFKDEGVIELLDLPSIQEASLTMQRWIMANPRIRELYHKLECDGYDHSYVDQYPNDIGVNHYDYRRVMEGIVYEQNDCFVFDSFWDGDLIEEDVLTHYEQNIILSTWKQLEAYCEIGDRDPTSITNSKF